MLRVMMNYACAKNKKFGGVKSGDFGQLVGIMDAEVATIRAQRGPNGEPPSSRAAQNFKSRCRVMLANVIPSYAKAKRLAPHLANSWVRWNEAKDVTIGGGAGSFGKLKNSTEDKRPPGRKSVMESRPEVVRRALWRLRGDDLSSPCPVRPPMVHGPFAGQEKRVLDRSKLQTFADPDFGLQRQPRKRNAEDKGRFPMERQRNDKLSLSVLYKITAPSKFQSIRASRFRKQRCATCMLRDRDGVTLQRYLYDEWVYDPKSTCIPCSVVDGTGVAMIEEPQVYFLPQLESMNEILGRRYDNECPIRLSNVNTCWSRLASAQYHYINGKRQKDCVQWLVHTLDRKSVVLVRDLSENFKTGGARESPAYMHTQHGLDGIYTMCLVYGDIPVTSQSQSCRTRLYGTLLLS
jgi:hypothetical protein